MTRDEVSYSQLLRLRRQQLIACQTTYPDPDTFKPERFLTADGALDPTVRNPCDIVFGVHTFLPFPEHPITTVDSLADECAQASIWRTRRCG